MSKYSPEILKEIDDLRAEGYSWEEVSDLFMHTHPELGCPTGNALRKAFMSYQTDNETTEDNLATLHTSLLRARQAAARERKVSKAVVLRSLTSQSVLDGVAEAVKGINKFKSNRKFEHKKSAKVDGVPMTAELLLSDLQIGKLMVNYNTEIALKRLEGYTDAALFKINQHMKSGYQMERVILALIGDIIESDKKHKNSARATDTGTASQIKNAIEGLYTLVIKPLATFCDYHGIEFEVIAVTG